MNKIMTSYEAAKLIEDGEIIAFNGFGSMGFPEELAKAVGERFDKTGSPRGLTIYASAGQGVWQKGHMIEDMCKPGMLSCVIAGHITPMINICEQISRNEIEGYNLPMGVISHLERAAAGRKPGIVTKIGLKTFIDPRFGGGAMNECSKRKLSEVVKIDGQEYLFYKSIKPDCALLRGTTADPEGNITLEKEALYADIYSVAMAAKANGGKVIVQVERLSGKLANPKEVKLPGVIVDAIVVSPKQKMSYITDYNEGYTGEWYVPENEVVEMVNHIKNMGAEAGRKRERNIVHSIIAKRAALEFPKKGLINLGIGIPEMIPEYVEKMGVQSEYNLTVEGGVIGGTPAPSFDFGCAINPRIIQDMALQFDLYDSGCLDATFLGAMQIDGKGNVNVSKTKDKVIGVGGFVDLTQSAKKVVYCFPFSAGGLQIEVDNGRLKIVREGRFKKFVKNIEQISASGEFAMDEGQKVLYITERCVFELQRGGLVLTEIAPGISLEDDILAQMDFVPLISDDLKLMDSIIF